jgi:hypothetical protein
MIPTLTLYILTLLCLIAATVCALDTIAAEGAQGSLPYFLIIGAGLLLLFGVLGVLWRLSA